MTCLFENPRSQNAGTWAYLENSVAWLYLCLSHDCGGNVAVSENVLADLGIEFEGGMLCMTGLLIRN